MVEVDGEKTRSPRAPFAARQVKYVSSIIPDRFIFN